MQPYSQEVRDTVLSLIPHENHRKLAEMLMDGASAEEISAKGFDSLQVEQYTSLINSVVNGDTPLKEATTPEEATPSEVTPDEAPKEATEPTVETTTEVTPEATQPEATQPEATQPEGETPTAPEAEVPVAPQTEDNVQPEGEIPA